MPRKAKKTLSKRTVSSLPAGARGGTWYMDASLPGFGVRVYEDRSKFFFARYRVKGVGVRRVVSLGRLGTVTFDQAKKKAKEYLSSAALGEDPRRKQRAMTWGEWTKTYLARLDVKRPGEHQRYLGVTPEKNRSTGEDTDPTFRVLRQKWAARPLDSFSPEDFEAARQEIRKGGKVRAARWLACTAAVFAAAVRAELISSNPAAKVKRDRESAPRDRILTHDELRALLLALDGEPDPWARAAIVLLLLTGARKGEILAAEWRNVDLEGRRIRLPDSKSGKPRLLALPPRAVELLRGLPRLGRYIIAGRDAGKPGAEEKPRADLKHAWRRLCARAGIEGATPHDLRRTWGLEVSRVAGVRIASLGLGHESIAVTESTYAPEAFSAIQDATDARERLLPFPEEKKPEDGERA